MSGKGDKQRPTDHEAYSNNYDVIFGKKEDDIQLAKVEYIPEEDDDGVSPSPA